MSTYLLTPRMSGLLDRIRLAGRPPFHTMSPEAARNAYTQGAEVLDLPRAPLARVQALEIRADDGAVLPARLYASSHERLPVLLYLHGGGFVIGGLETHDSLCRQLALRSGAAVVALDYRLAPEHPFPTAVEDSFAALRWLAGEGGAALGLNGALLGLGGDSAGGTLSAVCALLARDAGLPLALQLLLTPGTSAHAEFPSRHLFANGFLLDAASIDWFFNLYVTKHQRHDWRFAPLEAADVEGVAPATVILAECDPLVDEGVAYADKLRSAGVAVELEIFRGLTHDFIKMGRFIKEADTAQALAANAIKRAFT